MLKKGLQDLFGNVICRSVAMPPVELPPLALDGMVPLALACREAVNTVKATAEDRILDLRSHGLGGSLLSKENLSFPIRMTNHTSFDWLGVFSSGGKIQRIDSFGKASYCFGSP